MKNAAVWFLFLILAIVPAAHSSGLSSVNDWLYVLSMDNVSIENIANSGFDLVVMDYAKQGTEDSEFSPQEIQRLHEAGMIAIAYFSIGEAEDYRFYWKDEWNDNPPVWLGPVNPDWDGNYKVRYWDTGWKSILFGNDSAYLDRIISLGFDGVYLDIVDAFEYWSDDEPELSRLQARQAMKELIGGIRDYALNVRQADHFYIFPQNAPAIIVDENDELDGLGREYLQLCDGIGAEDTWYIETETQDPDEMEYAVSLLDRFRTDSLSHMVLSVDYVWDTGSLESQDNQDRYNQFHRLARERGFLPYTAETNRDLDSIISQDANDNYQYAQPLPNDPETPIRFWGNY